MANGTLHNPGRGQKLRPATVRANRLGREFKCIRWNLKRLADLNAA